MKKGLLMMALALGIGFGSGFGSTRAQAEEYVIDTNKAHAFIQFKVAHLGYSWLLGRFNDFEGSFSYDEKNPSASKVNITINVASVDTNHAERDKHLRSPDFFNVEAHPESTFVSKSFRELGNGKVELTGTFTLNGVTRDIIIDASHIGAGADPWGGYRRGFEGRTTLKLTDYNIAKAAMLGPASAEVELYFSFEGIRR